MRAAPSVEVRTAWQGGWWWAACLLWLLALLGWGGSLWAHAREGEVHLASSALVPWLLVVLVGLGVLSASAAALWHAHQHPAWLRWDGAAWRCTVPGVWDESDDDGLPGSVDTVIDIGDAMLLRWESVPLPGERLRRRVWLPVARSALPVQWHGLRTALQQHGRLQEPVA